MFGCREGGHIAERDLQVLLIMAEISESPTQRSTNTTTGCPTNGQLESYSDEWRTKYSQHTWEEHVKLLSAYVPIYHGLVYVDSDNPFGRPVRGNPCSVI